MEILPLTALSAEERRLKLVAQLIVSVVCIFGVVILALANPDESIIPVIAILGGVVGAVFGIVSYRKVNV